MKFQILISFLLFFASLSAQKVLNVRYPLTSNEIELIPGHKVNSITPGYTLWLPNGQDTKGLIVVPHERRDSIQKNNLVKYALKSKLAVMYVSTENPFEFLFKEKKSKSIVEDIQKVCTNFKIPSQNILFLGYSLSGTRALRLAIYTMQNEEFKNIKPKAIAISDAPLDMNRLYKYPTALLDVFNKSECLLAKDYLVQELDGTPTNSKARYNSYSPYTKTVRHGGNAAYFSDIPVRAYIRDDVNWASEQHGKCDYDLAEFINQLHLYGNEKAVLLETSPGRNQNTAWSGIDERELISWFSRLITN